MLRGDDQLRSRGRFGGDRAHAQVFDLGRTSGIYSGAIKYLVAIAA